MAVEHSSTHCHHVLPRTRAEVSSEPTTGLARTVAAMASAATTSGAWARARMLAMAPSLIGRPNTSAISRDNRSKLIAWVMCKWMISAAMEEPNGEPGSSPSGGRADMALRQQGQTPRWRLMRVTIGRIDGRSTWS